MNEQDSNQYVGKTFREVLASQPSARVMRAGKVRFAGIANYDPARLNVELDGDGLVFSEEVATVRGQTRTYTYVDEASLPNGRVVRAWWG